MTSFAFNLSRLHRKLDDEIRGELSRRYPESFKLLRLKKLRLTIKDRLQRLSAPPRQQGA